MCNTNVTSKDNPDYSACEFCIRNLNGNLLYAEAHWFGLATSMEAEAIAVWKTLTYYVKSRNT